MRLYKETGSSLSSYYKYNRALKNIIIMKYIKYLSGVLLTCLTLSASAQTEVILKKDAFTKSVEAPILKEATNQMHLSYCSPDLYTNGLGLRSTANIDACIMLPKEMLKPFIGAKITKIRVGLGGLVSHLKGWVKSHYTDSISLTSDTIAASQDRNWNEITFAKPYTITGDSIYLGYSCSLEGSRYYILVGDQDVKGTTFMAVNGKWKDYYGKGYGRLQIDCIVEGDNLPQYNLFASGYQQNEKTLKTGTNLSVMFQVKNIGSKAVSKASYSYQVDNEDPVTIDNYTCNVQPNNYGTLAVGYDIPTSLKIGDHTLKFKLLKAEGTDLLTDYLTSLSVPFTTYGEGFTRKAVLLEHFTTEECPNCPAGDIVLDSLISIATAPIAWVSHHAGFYTDEYTINESVSYVALLKIFGAPLACIDRTKFDGISSDNYDTPAFSIGYQVPLDGANVINQYITKEYSLPTQIDINLSSKYDATTRNLDITVSGTKKDGLSDVTSSPKVNIFLLENGLKGEQAGSDSYGYKGKTFPHNHVIRKVLTHDATISDSAYGQDITFNGNDYTFNISTKLDTSWVADNMQIIAFISKPKGDQYTSNVLNAIIKKLGEGTGIKDYTVVDKINLYAVDGTIHADASYDKLTVYNLAGMEVRNSMLGKGIYIARVTKGGTSFVSKVVVR